MKPSDIIDARYRLERLIGTGGVAEVWLAEDQRLGRWVAVKILRDSLLTDQEAELAANFEREARIIARLQHPNIVQVYDAGLHEGRNFIVMEYVHGYSLRALLEAQGRLPESQAAAYATQMAVALQYAHDQGVIHCDVKPENILIAEHRVPKLADFGIAETLTRTLTPKEAREILGTIAYLAPEVIQGAAPGPQSDVYSLALSLYEMVAGRLPWAGTNPAAVAGQRLAASAPPVRTFNHSVSPDLEAVLARALALPVAERFRSAGEFANALRNIGPAGRSAAVAPAVGAAAAAGAGLTMAGAAGARPERGVPPPPVRRHPAPAGGRLPDGPPRAGSGAGAGAVALIVLLVLMAAAAGLAVAIALSRGGGSSGGTPTPTPVPAIAPQPTATPTPSPTNEPTLTPTPTSTSTPRPTPTATPTRPIIIFPTPPRPGTPTPAQRPGSPTASPSPSSSPSPGASAPRRPAPQLPLSGGGLRPTTPSALIAGSGGD